MSRLISTFPTSISVPVSIQISVISSTGDKFHYDMADWAPPNTFNVYRVWRIVNVKLKITSTDTISQAPRARQISCPNDYRSSNLGAKKQEGNAHHLTPQFGRSDSVQIYLHFLYTLQCSVLRQSPNFIWSPYRCAKEVDGIFLWG
jgi:hypothetical protein